MIKYDYQLKYECVKQQIAKDMTEDLRKMLPDYYIYHLDDDIIEFDNSMATWITIVNKKTRYEYDIHISIEDDRYNFYEIFVGLSEEEEQENNSHKKLLDYIKNKEVDINIVLY